MSRPKTSTSLRTDTIRHGKLRPQPRNYVGSLAVDQIIPPKSMPVRAPRLGLFHLSHQHNAFSATVLLMVSSALSAVLGLLRTKYIAHVFGAGHLTDAYIAAFQLPDMISYFLVGGVASITLVSMLNRFREAGDDEGADRALSVVLTAMMVVLGAAILLAEILAPLYTRSLFPRFDPATAALCTHLTRLVLPAQLFFFAGGVLGSRLLVRKIFLYQAVTPLIYNLGIILGGILLAPVLGIDSLAWGVLGGALLGSFLLNGLGAFRSGLRFTPILDLRHPAFVEWIKLSLPLMAGVSLAMADKWIVSFYAAGDTGGITLLNNAKTLFNAPLTIVGAAAGSASLPFFSQLYEQRKEWEFNRAVNAAVSRLLAVGLLLSAWMIALAAPIVGFLKGGAYSGQAVQATGHYFALFALSLALWSAQGIYARAFYAARNTLVPAISGTIVTLASIPIYGLLFHHIGLDGLVIASNLGMLAHTVALAILLHKFRLVSLATLDFPEIAHALLAAAIAYAATLATVNSLPHPTGLPGDMLLLTAGTVAWAATGFVVLTATGSKLPNQLRRRA
jgi:putative peptidoglycan lipid II flippase